MAMMMIIPPDHGGQVGDHISPLLLDPHSGAEQLHMRIIAQIADNQVFINLSSIIGQPIHEESHNRTLSNIYRLPYSIIGQPVQLYMKIIAQLQIIKLLSTLNSIIDQPVHGQLHKRHMDKFLSTLYWIIDQPVHGRMGVHRVDKRCDAGFSSVST